MKYRCNDRLCGSEDCSRCFPVYQREPEVRHCGECGRRFWPVGDETDCAECNAPADLPAVAGKLRRDVGLSCAVCGSKRSVDYHNVGNVGISQSIPLCESCKPNKAICGDSPHDGAVDTEKGGEL